MIVLTQHEKGSEFMFYTTDTTEIVICDYCNGDGSIKDYTGDWGTCRECDGEGRVIKQTSVTYKKLPK